MSRAEKGRDAAGRVKFRIIEFEMEGTPSNLHEGMRAIIGALGRSPGAAIRITGPKSARTEATPESEAETLEEQTEPAVDGVAVDASGESSEARPRGRRSVPAVPTILNDLDLTSGDMPLRQYSEQKNPKTQNEKFLVVAGWLRTYRDIKVIGPDHIFTCFKILGWRCSNDIGLIFRNLRRRNQWFSSKGQSEWEMTIVGINHLDHNLGQNPSSD